MAREAATIAICRTTWSKRRMTAGSGSNREQVAWSIASSRPLLKRRRQALPIGTLSRAVRFVSPVVCTSNINGCIGVLSFCFVR